MNPQINFKPLLDDADVAEILNIELTMVRRLRNQRRVPIVKIGRRVLFTAEGIEEYVRQNTIDVVGR